MAKTDIIKQTIVLPVKCTHCGDMVTKRGNQKDGLVMGNIDGERLPLHKGCFHSVHNPMNNPETVAKSAKARRGQSRPTILGDKNPMKRPEVAAKVSKKLMGRDAYWVKGDKNPMRNPETAAKQGMTTRGDKHYMNHPEHRAKHRARMMGDKNPAKRPEIRAKISKALTGMPRPWNLGDKNPMKNPKHFDTWLKAISKTPNREENRLIPILEEFGFIYLKKIEIRRAPDFVHESDRRIIEYDGFMGHHPGAPWTPDTWKECLAPDDKRDQSYRDAGYHILRIFPEDLAEGDGFVSAKVGMWMLEG